MPELHAPPPPACKGCKAVVGVQEVSLLLAASLALQFKILVSSVATGNPNSCEAQTTRMKAFCLFL